MSDEETTITIKFWAVVTIIGVLFGWFFVAYANHDRRITTMETQYLGICEKLSDIKGDTREIKQAMSEHIRMGR